MNIAKGFFIIPEFGEVDFEDSRKSVDQGNSLYFGAKLQINF